MSALGKTLPFAKSLLSFFRGSFSDAIVGSNTDTTHTIACFAFSSLHLFVRLVVNPSRLRRAGRAPWLHPHRGRYAR